MIPTTLILTASFVFLSLPNVNNYDRLEFKEKPVKNNSSVSINLHIGDSSKALGFASYSPNVNVKNSLHSSLAEPAEPFTENPIELEDWMKYPKKWNNKNEI